ncbi:putative pre-16S rRNA nuclease isoform X3 [Cinnamomum micranthum f. kanehirae]|uniref:Putative pre-16S rRNA nuclease isoform X3 n=1 Tax=Cinnamomum micranthum f. kanehirae TaxID=337451 RepID=A0A443Q055_9MAGN|nr:putative pre-16S rRNA nuclease isoform X3 [Cinnamomum micranthum f. kanehirae]
MEAETELVNLGTEVKNQGLMKLLQPIELFQLCLKTNAPKQGRLLGLDVGVKYVGLAVSDPCNVTAAPLSVLVRKKTNIDFMAKDFQQLVSELSLVGFVVGCPFGGLWSSSVLETVQVKVFMEDIRQTGKLEGLGYTYWDERFTSKCVQSLLKPLKLQPVPYKIMVDKFAAVGILQSYLDHVTRTCSEDKGATCLCGQCCFYRAILQHVNRILKRGRIHEVYIFLEYKNQDAFIYSLEIFSYFLIRFLRNTRKRGNFFCSHEDQDYNLIILF